jgi:hypothetical protein
MRRAPIVAAALALAVPAAAAAQTPAGLPDVAQMALAPADLPSGATVEDQGSLPLSGYVGYYYRAFRFSRAAARQTGVRHLESDVALLKTRPRASSEYAGLRGLYRNTASGRSFVRLVAALSGINARRVHVGAARPLALGDGAFVVRATVTTRHGKVGMAFAGVMVDRAVAEIDTIGRARGARLMRETRTALAAAADRLRRGLSPVSVSPPSVSGTAKVGAALHATAGTWGDFTKPTSFAYRWERCNAQGAACTTLPGATHPDYVIVDGDRSSTLRVAVTAANASGATTVVSSPTLAIP